MRSTVVSRFDFGAKSKRRREREEEEEKNGCQVKRSTNYYRFVRFLLLCVLQPDSINDETLCTKLYLISSQQYKHIRPTNKYRIIQNECVSASVCVHRTLYVRFECCVFARFLFFSSFFRFHIHILICYSKQDSPHS